MRNLLEWWRERQRRQAWEKGPARKPGPEELEELRARLRAVNELREAQRAADGESWEGPFVDDIHEYLDRMESKRRAARRPRHRE